MTPEPFMLGFMKVAYRFKPMAAGSRDRMSSRPFY